MMAAVRAKARSALGLLVIAALLLAPESAFAEDARKTLRKEKARLTEMRKRAEDAAAELDRTLRRERAARRKVDDIQKRLSRQRRLIARIDRRLSELGREMEKAESEVRVIEAEMGSVRHGLEQAVARTFQEGKEEAGILPEELRRERMRYFAGRVIASEAERYGRLTSDREDKEVALSGIEREVKQSEKRFSREARAGRSLESRQEREARRLAQIEAQKKKKEKELKALRARVERMEALVSRIERQVREAERKRLRGAAPAGPTKFSGVPGGLVAPVRGRVVGRFGKIRDPVFDVWVENHGVEIEASSGAPIRSIGRGNVVFSGTVSGFGKVLIIQHGTGLFSVYGKADSFSVAQGQVVAPGQNIGRLPESPGGKSVLYLELRAGGTAIDPAAVISLPE